MSDLHYKADGSLDMRFSSSKDYVASNSGCSSNFGYSSNNDTSSNDLHYRRDGGLDMRYSSSKAFSTSNNENSVFSSNNHNNYSNGLHYRRDGGLDMRYSSSKEHESQHNQFSPRNINYHTNNNNLFNNLHFRRDGGLDMRYSSSKTHAPIKSRNPFYNDHQNNYSTSEIHYRKDGNLDRRYSSSKYYDVFRSPRSEFNMDNKESHCKRDNSLDKRYSSSRSNENSFNKCRESVKSSNASYYKPSSGDELHYKRDGTLDMRYSSSKAFKSSNNELRSNRKREDSVKRHNNESNNRKDSDNLHYKRDGSLDMRYSTSKAFAAKSKDNTKKHNKSIKSRDESCDESQNEDLHYRKDGKLDMRYSTSKAFASSNKDSSSQPRKTRKRGSSVKSHKNYQSTNELHYKKDGTLDMRYASSKKAMHKENIEPPNYENDLIKRKDGYLDMRYKVCKEYSALPKDTNGEINENSPEAISFRNEHSLNLTPSINFDFSSITPVSYSGQNKSIQKVFKTAKHTGKKFLGRMTLYHATSKKAAEQIMKSNQFRPGSSGMFGAAMYFADKKQAAIYKAAKLDSNGENALIVANVDMGTALVVEGPNTKLDLKQVRYFGCDSVLGRKTRNSDWEYVVYEPSRIQPIKMISI